MKIRFFLKRFSLVFLLSLVVFWLINGASLRNWSLSGDDLYSLTNAFDNPYKFSIGLKIFSGQYRPLSYALFSFYKYFLPNFFLIFLLHSFLNVLLFALFIFLLSKKLGMAKKFLITLPILFSPIFYYHVFTISSLANLLMCIIFLLLVLILKQKEIKFNLLYFSFFLVFLSFFIKEAFLIHLALFVLIQLKAIRQGKIQASFHFLGLAGIIFAFFIIKRVSAYSWSFNSDDFFVFSLKKVLENIFHILMWLLNFPKGWQYGVPIRSLLHYLFSFFNLIILTAVFILSFIKNKLKTLTLFVLMFLSIAPFLFLKSVMPYYMDTFFLLFLLTVQEAYFVLKKTNNKLAYIFISIFLFLNISNLFLAKNQWLEYSFVARANQAAKNYRKILEDNDYYNKEQICISKHHRGVWATEDGNLAKHLSKKEFEIISTQSAELPKKCFINDSLNLKNDAWDYFLY